MKINWRVWALLPLRSLLFAAAFFFVSGISRKDLTDITHWWSIIASAVNLVTIVALWIIYKRDGITYCELIRYEKKQGNFLKGFLFVFMMLLIGMGGRFTSDIFLCLAA